ncbi:MAG: efflux RND transporter periplasmic adaptor subunit [Myxococcota bacterium]
MIPVLLALAGCGSSADPADAAVTAVPEVRTAVVEAATWRPTAEITGSADPVQAVQLGFDVPGRLGRVSVHRGDVVELYQALGSLDAAVSADQLAQAQAGVAAAEAGAAAAEDTWQRLQKMGASTSAGDLAKVEAQVKGARAQLEQARAAERMASTMLKQHTLRAPISGVVTVAPDNPGTMVGAGSPLFAIEDLSSLRVKGTASETDDWLVAGLPATVRAGTGAETAPATVERVLSSLDPATRRLPVEIRIDAPPSWLRAHAFVRVTVESATDVQVLAVPKGALVARPEFAVLVMAGPSAAPVRVPVVVVGEDGDRTLIRGAIEPGALVAVDPPQGFGA